MLRPPGSRGPTIECTRPARLSSKLLIRGG